MRNSLGTVAKTDAPQLFGFPSQIKLPAELSNHRLSCATVNGYTVLALSKKNGESDINLLQVLNEEGQAVTLSDTGCDLGFTGKNLVDAMHEFGISVQNFVNKFDASFKILTEGMCLTADEASNLENSLKPFVEANNRELEAKLAELDTIIFSKLPAFSHIYRSPDGSSLHVSGNEGELVVLQVQEGQSENASVRISKKLQIDRSDATVQSKDLPGEWIGNGTDSTEVSSVKGSSLTLQKSGNALAILDQAGKLIWSEDVLASCYNCCEGSVLYAIDERQQIYVLKFKDDKIESSQSFQDLPISTAGEVDVEIFVEPSNSFLFVSNFLKDSKELRISAYDIEEGRFLNSFEFECKHAPSVSIDEIGNIYVAGTEQNFLTKLSTNIESLLQGEEQPSIDLNELKGLADIIKNLEDPEVEADEAAPSVESEASRYVKNAVEALERRFGPQIEAARSNEELDLISKKIDHFKESPNLRKYPDLFIPISKMLSAARDEIELEAFVENVEKLDKKVRQSSEALELPGLLQEYEELKALRSKFTISSEETRLNLGAQLDSIKLELQQKKVASVSVVQAKLEVLFDSLGQVYNSLGSIEELSSQSVADLTKDITGLLFALPRDQRLAGLGKLNKMSLAVLENLSDDSSSVSEAQLELLHDKLQYMSDHFHTVIRSSLDRLASTEELENWLKESKLYLQFRTQLAEFEPAERNILESELNVAIEEKRRDLQEISKGDVPVRNNRVILGRIHAPIFPGYSSPAIPTVVPAVKGESKGRLTFVGTGGRLFEPDCAFVPIDLGDEKTQEAVNRYKREAINYFQSLERKIPERQSFWVFNEHVIAQLEKLALNFGITQQLMRPGEKGIKSDGGQGLVILEGDAGTGKNVFLEMYAYLTKRELFTFACNRKTEKEDMMYAYNFDKERGTYRATSELMHAIQTPGALIVLDEINTLPEGASKLLNSLFDRRRRIFMPHDKDVIAAPSTLFAAAMNYRHYIGTSPLPQEFVDRAILQEVDYPAFKVTGEKGDRFMHYEAQVAAQYMSDLVDFSPEKFKRAWNSVINNDHDPDIDSIISVEAQKSLVDLQTALKAANRIRDAYRNYQSGRSSQVEVNLVFSQRGMEYIAAAMSMGLPVNEAIEHIVIPKGATPDEKDTLKSIINIESGAE